jgi:hypothetical protein
MRNRSSSNSCSFEVRAAVLDIRKSFVLPPDEHRIEPRCLNN